MSTMEIQFRTDLITPQSPLVCDFLNSWKAGYRQVVASGPRNTSKSLHALAYWLTLHEEVPNLRSLIVRSEAKTIRTTVLRTLEDKLLRYPFSDKRNPFRLIGGTKPTEIVFDNGGKCDFGGMDDSGKVLGGSYDFIFFNQVERERNEKHWADLLGTMAGARNNEWFVHGRPFYQIVADANPSDPTHWLYRRKGSKALKWYDFKHVDHPLLYDWDKREYTERGLETIRDLEDAYPPGHLRDRMVYGHWVAASGLVYPHYEAKKHVKEYERRHFPDDDWDWVRAVDYGWNDPNVCDLWAVRKDKGRAVLFKEIYKSKLPINDFGKMINEMCAFHEIPPVLWTVTDHDPAHNEELNKMGIGTVNADKTSILRNINLVRQAFTGNKLRFNSDMLWHPVDSELMEQSLPTSCLEEIVRYRHEEPENQKSDGTADYPMKSCSDHSMNAMEYMVGRLWGGRDRPRLSPKVLLK